MRMTHFRRLALTLAVVAGGLGLAQNANPKPELPALVIPIDTDIGPSIQAFLEKGLNQAEKENRPLVVLAIDTPGGRVDNAIAMSDRIVASSVPTLAVVQNAFSAGALIAMSAEQVAMLPASEIGAALPITGGGQALDGQVGEKINSALRTKFRAVAETRGRNADAAEGMVNPNKVIPGLKEKGEILTLTSADAVKYNIANLEARTLDDAVRDAGYAKLKLERLERGPAELIGAFLSQPIVAGVLLAVGIIGILIELFHPGVALPGIIGGLALVAYFAGSFLSGNGSSVALLLLLAGLALIAAELILIPGSTIVGLLGIGSILASIYLQFGNQFPLVASLTVILSGVGLGLAFWLLPRSSVMNRVLALGASLEGTTATGPQSDIHPNLVGRYGQAVSDLRPAGVANIEGERLDVVSDGEFVTAGTRLEVVRVEGRRVVVKPVRS